MPKIVVEFQGEQIGNLNNNVTRFILENNCTCKGLFNFTKNVYRKYNYNGLY